MFKLMTTFDGRITRKQYWIGALLLIVLVALAFLIVGALLVAAYALTGWIPAEGSLAERLMVVAVVLVILPSGYAILRKRVNDLDHPAWTVWVSLALLLLDVGAAALGGRYFDGVGMSIVGVLVILNCLWATVIGFMRGTEGPNRHGPDPLAPAMQPNAEAALPTTSP